MDTNYHISFTQVKDNENERKLYIDEVEQPDAMFTLVNDQVDHRVEFRIP